MKIKQLQWNKLNRAYMVHDSVCYWVREKKTGWVVQVSTRNGARVDDLPAQTTEAEAKLMAQKHFESLVAIEEPPAEGGPDVISYASLEARHAEYAERSTGKHKAKKINTRCFLEAFNGSEWVHAGGPFATEEKAWAYLGGNDVDYRTVDEEGNALTSKQEAKKK